MDQTDIVFNREMKRIKLASKYSINAANKLPLKPLVKERYKGRKIPIMVDVRVTLRDAAMQKKQVKITYKKTTNNEIKVYQLEPYSFRYLRLKVGVRKVLFGYDVKEKKIKSFALKNIIKIEKLGTGYVARWPIEIGKKMRKKSIRKLGK